MLNAVKAWAAAWSRKDMSAYAGAYTSDFKGSSASHAAWLADRRDRIVGRKSIQVSVSEVQVDIKPGGVAEVRLRQSYQSDTLSTQSRKSLELQKVGGRWLISQESGR